jgi:hypothetical protein
MSLDLDAIKAHLRTMQTAQDDEEYLDAATQVGNDATKLAAEVERLRAAEARVRKLIDFWLQREGPQGDFRVAALDVRRALDNHEEATP